MIDPIALHGMGPWRDPVGAKFEKKATEAVDKINRTAMQAAAAIEKVKAYNEDDVQYTSKRDQIYNMKVEFHGC